MSGRKTKGSKVADAELTAEERRKRRRSSQRALGILWLAILVGGSLWIWFGEAEPLVDIMIPVLALLVYAGLGLRVRHANFQRFADSVYFTGFLWTLIALIAALWLGAEPDISSILRTFGYALTATLAGMFIRTWLLQFHLDETEVTDEDVAQEASVLSEKLAKAAESIGSLAEKSDVADKSIERLGSSTGEVAGSLSTSAGKIGTTLENVSTELGSAATKALAQLNSTMKEAGKSAALAETTSLLVRSADALTQSFQALEAAAAKGDRPLETLKTDVESLVKVATEHHGTLARLREKLDEATTTGAAELATSLAEAQRTIAEARQEGLALSATLEEIVEFMQRRFEGG